MRFSAAVLLSVVFILPAYAGEIADVEVFDLTDNRSLPIYDRAGRLYVVGEPRHQYELRVHNRSNHRVLAVTSVDGINVVTGKTAAEFQSGYVLESWGTAVIDGWRKSLHDVATFFFSKLKDSYAARTGRPNNVGVIGVAVFRERTHCCFYPHEQLSKAEEALPSAPTADSSAARASSSDRDVSKQHGSDSRLGTGHGHREHSPATYVDFERASSQPDETIVIYYDSHRNLVAQGIVPPHRPYAYEPPSAFPDGFVPDP